MFPFGHFCPGYVPNSSHTGFMPSLDTVLIVIQNHVSLFSSFCPLDPTRYSLLPKGKDAICHPLLYIKVGPLYPPPPPSMTRTVTVYRAGASRLSIV
jgi:hypothetical protein